MKSHVLIALGIIEKRGKVLVGLRYSPDEPKGHGMWEIAGGKVELSESPEQAVVRELREETGYRVKVVSHEARVTSFVWPYPQRDTHIVALTYHCKIVGGTLLKKPKEDSEWKWITARDYKNLKFTPGTKDALKWWFYGR